MGRLLHEDCMWCDLQEIAEMFGKTERTVRNYIYEGRIEVKKLPGSCKLWAKSEDIEKYAEFVNPKPKQEKINKFLKKINPGAY